MGISRASLYKRRLTGGKRKVHRKKRKFEMGRQPSATKIGSKRIHLVRCRGGNFKSRALRLETGNFSWATEAVTRKTRIVGVSYNATSNELVRTNTLVKGAVIQIDAAPFKQWFEKYYATALKKRTTKATEGEKKEETVARKDQDHKIIVRQRSKAVDAALEEQFATGKLLAKITSRPGQSGRADGYILEGEELAFYQKKMVKH
jgi:small subunit ribosomal protein S8e